jgi:hypothetical protein
MAVAQTESSTRTAKWILKQAQDDEGERGKGGEGERTPAFVTTKSAHLRAHRTQPALDCFAMLAMTNPGDGMGDAPAAQCPPLRHPRESGDPVGSEPAASRPHSRLEMRRNDDAASGVVDLD